MRIHEPGWNAEDPSEEPTFEERCENLPEGFTHADGAAHWATYLINGDASGLEEGDALVADSWLLSVGALEAIDCGEPFFSWSFGDRTGYPVRGGDLVTYIVRVDTERY